MANEGRRSVLFTTPIREDLTPSWLWGSCLGVVGTLAWFGNILGFWQTSSPSEGGNQIEIASREQQFVARKEQRRAEAYASSQVLIERKLRNLPMSDFPPLGDPRVKVKEIEPNVWLVEGCIRTADRWGASCEPSYRAKLRSGSDGSWVLTSFQAYGLPSESQYVAIASL